MRAAALSLVPLALVSAGLAPPAQHAFGFDAAALAAAEYVTQKQDHFDDGNANNWQQAYYVNRDHWVRRPLPTISTTITTTIATTRAVQT